MSLNGKLNVGVISCPDLLPDLWRLVDDFDVALAELLECVGPTLRFYRRRSTYVSVGEQLPVGLYDSEKECRADAEQQHAVHRFEGA